MKYLTIVDCQTVERDTDDERVDELLEQLKASVKLSCKHRDVVSHHSRTADTGELFTDHHCQDCNSFWTTWEI